MEMVRGVIVSNNILRKSFSENIPIDHMKLQKLIYILYKTYLKETDKFIFTEKFSAWKYGPVLESVYHEFKNYLNAPITQYYSTESVQESCKFVEFIDESNYTFKKVLDEVWNKYKVYTSISLAEMTHLEGGAWQKAVNNGTYVLSVEDIKKEEDFING